MQNEFYEQQQRAIHAMREMNKKSTNPQNTNHKKSPEPSQKKQMPPPIPELPFSNIFKEKDTALILSLLLILYGEKADKLLLYALIYILL